MNTITSLIFIIGPVILGVYLSTRAGRNKTENIVVWVFCLIIAASGIFEYIQSNKDKRNNIIYNNYNAELLEKAQLYHMGLMENEIDLLGEDPLFNYNIKKGDEYQKNGEYNNAIKKYKTALSKPNVHPSNKVFVNVSIAACNIHLKDIKNAKKCYSLALEEADNIEVKDRSIHSKAVVFWNLAKMHNSIKNFKESQNYYNKAIKMYRKINKKSELAFVLTMLANNLFIQEKYIKSKNAIEEAILLYDGLDNKNDKAFCHTIIAGISTSLNNLKQAEDNILIALDIFEKLNDKRKVSDTYRYLGAIKLLKNEYKDGLEAVTKAINISTQLKDENLIFNNFQALYMMISYITGDYSKGKEIVREAFKHGTSKDGHVTLNFQIPILDDSNRPGKKSLNK